MNRKRIFGALLLTLSLLCAMAVPASAVGPELTYQNRSGNSVSLTFHGLEGESVYGVQVELIAPERYDTVSFVPAGQDVFSPGCRTVVEENSTKIVVYLTAQEPLNKGEKLSVGTLTLDKAFIAPSQATVTLLGHELKPLAQADKSEMPVSERIEPTEDPGNNDNPGGGGSSSGGGGGGGGSSRPRLYQVKLTAAEHGTVKVEPTQAEAKSTVTVTTEPEKGWSLKELKVTTSTGNTVTLTELDGGRYTFKMPSSNVTVTASFQEEKKEEEKPVLPPMAFSDVNEGDWFYNEVRYVYENGLMTGMGDHIFAPNTEASRGMVVTVLHRMEGSPAAELANFSDVPANQYYAQPVGWANANGIVSGYGGNETGTFGPNNSITREQLAAVLYRYAARKGLDTTARGDLSVFTDQGAIQEYAVEPLSWAVGVGLINGMGDGTVLPGGNATRAQIATILTRYCQNIAAEKK